jgi:hypothetical protein
MVKLGAARRFRWCAAAATRPGVGEVTSAKVTEGHCSTDTSIRNPTRAIVLPT